MAVQQRENHQLCLHPHLRSQLLLAIHQTLYVGRVVAAALAGRDGAFKCGAGDLWGDGGGGGQGARAHAGWQQLAQGLGGGSWSHGCHITQLLPQQEQVTGLLHLVKHHRQCQAVSSDQCDWREGHTGQVSTRIFKYPPHAAVPFSPVPTGAPGWDYLLWASIQPGSLLHAHKPLMCPALFSSSAASLLMTKKHLLGWSSQRNCDKPFMRKLTWASCVRHLAQAQLEDASNSIAVTQRFNCVYIKCSCIKGPNCFELSNEMQEQQDEVSYQSGVLEYPLPNKFLRDRGGEILASRE